MAGQSPVPIARRSVRRTMYQIMKDNAVVGEFEDLKKARESASTMENVRIRVVNKKIGE